jgi:hypothetical protein
MTSGWAWLGWPAGYEACIKYPLWCMMYHAGGRPEDGKHPPGQAKGEHLESVAVGWVVWRKDELEEGQLPDR